MMTIRKKGKFKRKKKRIWTYLRSNPANSIGSS